MIKIMVLYATECPIAIYFMAIYFLFITMLNIARYALSFWRHQSPMLHLQIGCPDLQMYQLQFRDKLDNYNVK